jgi:hypothetical protein
VKKIKYIKIKEANHRKIQQRNLNGKLRKKQKWMETKMDIYKNVSRVRNGKIKIRSRV